MQRFNYRVTYDTGSLVRWVANPTVTVYDTGTLNLSTIYDDDGVTVKANPFTGPSTGLVYFYAADAKYDVLFTGGTPALGAGYTISAELLDDTLALGALASAITTLNLQTGAVQTLVTGTANNDFTITSGANVHTFDLPTASNTKRGALSTADWSTFNAKIGSLNGLTNIIQTLAVGSAGAAPAWISAGGVHTLHLPVASATKSGILSSGDWSTFNAKLTLAAGTNLQYVRGDLTMQTLNTTVVPEGANLYFTDARARLAISATAPVTYNNVTGAIGMPAATGAANGYLSSADWNTFTNGIITTGTQTFAGDKTWTGTTTEKRIKATGGTDHVTGDYALHANWGNAASISNLSAKDQRGKFTVNSAGAGQSTNPTITLTFKDGSWTTTPQAIVVRNGGDQITAPTSWTTSATQLVITFSGTPVGGEQYNYNFIVMG